MMPERWLLLDPREDDDELMPWSFDDEGETDMWDRLEEDYEG